MNSACKQLTLSFVAYVRLWRRGWRQSDNCCSCKVSWFWRDRLKVVKELLENLMPRNCEVQNLFHWMCNVNHCGNVFRTSRAHNSTWQSVAQMKYDTVITVSFRNINIPMSLLRPSSSLVLTFGTFSNCPHGILTSHQLSLKYKSRNSHTPFCKKYLVVSLGI